MLRKDFARGGLLRGKRIVEGSAHRRCGKLFQNEGHHFISHVRLVISNPVIDTAHGVPI